MRVIRWVMVVVLLTTAVAAWVWHAQRERATERLIGETRAALREIEAQIRLQAAVGKVELNGRGWPTTVDPSWFGGSPPRNPLLDARRPWLEVASEEEYGFEDPPVRVALDGGAASFWYNPGLGVLRARVPQTVSDRRAIELYNRANGTSIDRLFAVEEPERLDSIEVVPREPL